MKQIFDVVIAGSGAAGLYCALCLDKRMRVLIVTKQQLRDCNSYLAQGGITTVLGEEDRQSFIEDTMCAGQDENDVAALNLLADYADMTINELTKMGMPFDMQDGKLLYTREGAHSKNRIVYAKDETGKHLVETLIAQVLCRDNITLWEHSSVVDILEDAQTHACAGVLIKSKGKTTTLTCRKVVLASGGIGGLFKNTTNQPTVCGDAAAIASKHGISLKHMHYIQFHPTSLYRPSGDIEERRFLISESLRGEGAYLLNAEKQRFVDELLPRNTVTAAIREEMKKFPNTPFVYLDISHEDDEMLRQRFPSIYAACLEAGYDMTKESIPVTPTQHYHMGGIAVDLAGRTSMRNLYAIGESSCTGVHGTNRLASNSLLEALVYAARAAKDMNRAAVVSTVFSSTDTRHFLLYEELIDANRRAAIVEALIDEDGRLQHELFHSRRYYQKSV